MIARLWVRPGLILFVLAIVVGSNAAVRADVTSATITSFTVVAMIAMVLGEQMPMKIADRVIAPLTTAPALGLILAPLTFDGQAASAATVLALIWLSILVGGLLNRARGQSVVEGSLGARFLGMSVAAVLARGIVVDGTSLLEWAAGEQSDPAVVALSLLAVAAAGGVVDLSLETLEAWRRGGRRLAHLLTAERGAFVGIGAATVASGPLIALAQPFVGWAAIPLLLLPVILSYVAVRRLVAIRQALEESVVAMSRLSSLVGVTRSGHVQRVTRLAVRVGVAMELDPPMLRRIQGTALLHDVGQLALAQPLLGGATIDASADIEAEIAAAGVRVVGSSPDLVQLVPLLDEVRTPFRQTREFGEDIPLESRIVRVANAWDDITEGARSPWACQVALERLHLGLGYDYDPEVVAALERTLT